jgi:YegS/Rv2252/BmrU family lipid kinase
LRILVIANPAAGTGRAAARVARLVRALESHGHSVDVRATRARGDASRQARDAEGRVDCIIAAGGDGTLNEVLNGLADPSRTLLAPFALGTANMLARQLALPSDPERLAEVIRCAHTRRIDLGQTGKTRFLSVAGVGFDGLVTETLARSRRGTLGYRGYAAPILAALRRYAPPRITVRLDGGAPIGCAFVIVSKLANYGGIFCATPAAQPDSGVFEVCLFPTASVPDLARYAGAALWARFSRKSAFRIEKATRVEIAASEPTPVQLDGDHWGYTPLSLELTPAMVPMCVPAASAPVLTHS